jgi:hypothetical protein
MLAGIENRLLMSDSLRGVIPSLEENVANLGDSVVVTSLVLETNSQDRLVTGAVVGISREETGMLKIDIRVSISEAFEVFRMCSSRTVICKECFVNLIDEILSFGGPYEIVSVKMTDFDRQRKTCILGVDLIDR